VAKKIDYYGQILLLASVILTAILSPFWPLGIFFSLFCFVPLGVWQLISAAIIWFGTKQNARSSKPLNQYWIYAFVCLSACIISIVSVSKGNQRHFDIYKYLFVISMVGSVIVSVYFVFIYKKYYLHNEAKKDSGSGGVCQSRSV
jgi:hypothetical protein